MLRLKACCTAICKVAKFMRHAKLFARKILSPSSWRSTGLTPGQARHQLGISTSYLNPRFEKANQRHSAPRFCCALVRSLFGRHITTLSDRTTDGCPRRRRRSLGDSGCRWRAAALTTSSLVWQNAPSFARALPCSLASGDRVARRTCRAGRDAGNAPATLTYDPHLNVRWGFSSIIVDTTSTSLISPARRLSRSWPKAGVSLKALADHNRSAANRCHVAMRDGAEPGRGQRCDVRTACAAFDPVSRVLWLH